MKPHVWRPLKALFCFFDSQCFQNESKKISEFTPGDSRETRDNTCLYPNANLKYLLNDIAESKDLERKWRKNGERGIPDAARRGRVQNLLLLRRIAIGGRHATKEKSNTS